MTKRHGESWLQMRCVDRECSGFSLIEIMIVLVIAASVIATGLAWLSAERKRAARGDAIATQALEMATFGRALDQYLRRGAVLPPLWKCHHDHRRGAPSRKALAGELFSS